MVVEEVVASFPSLEGPIKTLVVILQIIGGIIGIYLVFWMVNTFINARRVKVLKNILRNVEEINVKLSKRKK